ncbi:MAG: Integral rane protein [Pseudomonas sp.]|uniref:EamA family transporter n=1 Tax=Pseudomonas sp. TaxID=306 RepID=UPI0026180F54|nr:EamA family transporter [Pseudomonas sp.]MDB6048257.1 Integral rane protein [Pseudomonas sp.]
MTRSYVLGVAAAVFATFSWALNFLSPYMMGDFGPVDFITMRFIVSGCIGLVMMCVYWPGEPGLSWHSMVTAGLLGLLGYALYIGCIMGSVLHGGAIIAPAFLSATPVIIAVTGNMLERTVSWDRLAIPIVLAVFGLVATNYGAVVDVVGADVSSYRLAVGYATGAVLAWLMFSVLNQQTLERIPQVHSGLWTGLMMSGAGLSVLLFIPFGLEYGMYSYPHIDLRVDNTLPVFAAAAALACVASVGGAWAWNFASQRLPMALSGQLISVETIFAASFGLIAEHRLPTGLETLGVISLLAGATIAVRVTAQKRGADSNVQA